MNDVPTDYLGLAEYLRRHLENERHALEHYERLVTDRPDDAVSYMVRAILRDEARHHELFTEILNSLESAIRWEDMTPRLPRAGAEIADGEALIVATDEMLAMEREDLRELRRLRKAWEKTGGELEFWAVLIGGAELDTQKHIRLLEYLRKLIS